MKHHGVREIVGDPEKPERGAWVYERCADCGAARRYHSQGVVMPWQLKEDGVWGEVDEVCRPGGAISLEDWARKAAGEAERDLVMYASRTDGGPENGLSRAYPNDAGIDIEASADVTVPIGKFADVPCGIAVAMPPGTWGMLVGRSSSIRKRGLLVYHGIIDPGYRGELFAGVLNVGNDMVIVQEGERIAQLILMHNVTSRVGVAWAGELPAGNRGANGFGSSGQ